jgi:hypothetical protein
VKIDPINPLKTRVFAERRDHSDYRTVSPYWVLPVYVKLIWAVWADTKGTGHNYFDEMRSSFNLVQNQLFCAHETQYLQKNGLNLSKRTSSSAEKGNVK